MNAHEGLTQEQADSVLTDVAKGIHSGVVAREVASPSNRELVRVQNGEFSEYRYRDKADV